MEGLNDVSNSEESVVGMNNATFDTYAAASELQAHGFTEDQAVATVSMVRNAMNESVATKADIAQLESRIQTYNARLESRMETLESRMKADYAQLESSMKSDYLQLKSSMKADNAQLRSDMKADYAQLESSMKADSARLEYRMENLENRMKADNAELDSRLTKRLYVVAFGIVAITVGLLKLLD